MNQANDRLWTVMVYMVGDVGLDYNGFTDLKEMKLAGSTDEVALLAQFCRGVKHRPAKRYYLTKDSRDGTLAADVIEELGETKPSNPETVAEFFRWGIDRFPAHHYMAVLWGHGTGANDETLPNVVLPSAGEEAETLETVQVRRPVLSTLRQRGIAIGPSANAFDAFALDSLDCRKFKKALELVHASLGRKLDILGMDSCVMSGAEVCYQVRDSVRLTVAAEGSGPVDGWPYDTILGALVDNPTMKPEALAVTIAENFIASYADCEDLSVTQSVCNLEKCDLLAAAIDRLAQTLTTKLIDAEVRKALMLARLQVQTYEHTEYVDLYDFCALLREHARDEEVRAVCEGLMEAVYSGFVVKSLYQGDAMQYSYGVSIYFPLHEVSRSYELLDIAKDTRWVPFLKEYLAKIRRPSREEARAASA